MITIIFMFYYVNKINSYEEDYGWLKQKSYNSDVQEFMQLSLDGLTLL